MPREQQKMPPERVFADTNLFLRYLTNDVPEQADAVDRLLRSAGVGEVVLVANAVVIAEIVWTLESFYGLSRQDIRTQVMAILNTPGLEIADRDLVLQAIADYAERNVDFAYAYNAGWLQSEGMKAVYTFDRRHFSRFEGITVQAPGDM